MKLVVDVNLPPKWVEFLATGGIQAVHWSSVGDLRATDALESGAIVTIDEIAAGDAAGPDRMRPHAASLRGIAVNGASP